MAIDFPTTKGNCIPPLAPVGDAVADGDQTTINNVTYEYEAPAGQPNYWRTAAGAGNYLPITGGTINGDLNITGDLDVDTDVNIDGDLVVDGNTSLAELNSGPLGGFRNKIINGDFKVTQRAVSLNGAGYGGPDRWYNLSGSIQQVNRAGVVLPPGFVYGASFGALAATNVGVLQGIEFPGNGTTQNIAGAIQTSVAGHAGPYLPNSVWTLSYYATEQLTPNAVFRDVVGSINNQIDLSAGFAATQVLETNVGGSGYNRYAHVLTIPVASVPAATNTCLVVGAFNVGGNFTATGFQWESGNVATPFEQRDYKTELFAVPALFPERWCLSSWLCGFRYTIWYRILSTCNSTIPCCTNSPRQI